MGLYVLDFHEIDRTQVALVAARARTWASFRGLPP